MYVYDNNMDYVSLWTLPVVSQVVVVRVVRRKYLPAAGLVSSDRLSSTTAADYRFLGAEGDQGAARISGFDVVVVMLL